MKRTIIALTVAATSIAAVVGAAFAFDASRADEASTPSVAADAAPTAAPAAPEAPTPEATHRHEHAAHAKASANDAAAPHDDAHAGASTMTASDEPAPPSMHDAHDHMHDPATDAAPGAPATMPLSPDAHHAPLDATPEQIACGNDLVRRTQDATARFADYDIALAEGYRSNPNNPEGTHFNNPTYERDGMTMDLARPEALIYRTNPDTGEKALLGVLFKMPRGQSGPQPCGPVTWWHTHANCIDPATREATLVRHGATCPEGQLYRESVEMMHVWFIPGRANGVSLRPVEEAPAP